LGLGGDQNRFAQSVKSLGGAEDVVF
jgi:hypothetical protein